MIAKYRILLAASLLMMAACNSGKPVAVDQVQPVLPSAVETEAYIRKSSAEWANVAVTGDTAPLKRIIANDYVGVSSWGEVRDKTRMLKPPTSKAFARSRVDYVNIRHFGDTAIAQGAETLTPRGRGAELRLIWTDIWMFRDGKWQIVASQDSVRPPAA